MLRDTTWRMHVVLSGFSFCAYWKGRHYAGNRFLKELCRHGNSHVMEVSKVSVWFITCWRDTWMFDSLELFILSLNTGDSTQATRVCFVFECGFFCQKTKAASSAEMHTLMQMKPPIIIIICVWRIFLTHTDPSFSLQGHERSFISL